MTETETPLPAQCQCHQGQAGCPLHAGIDLSVGDEPCRCCGHWHSAARACPGEVSTARLLDEDVVSPQYPERVLFTKIIDMRPDRMLRSKPHTAVLAELMDADPNFDAGMAEMRAVVEVEVSTARLLDEV